MAISKELFDEMLSGGKLPSPTGVALRLIDLTRKDDVSIDEIARTMQADPALSGRVIKFSNMASNGPRRPVVSVPDAIQRAGLNIVRQLVLGFSVLGQSRSGICRGFDYSLFWSRCLATAVAANTLSLRMRISAADEAFTCGLLADVGSLALATVYPKEYSVVLDAMRDAAPPVRSESERREFRTDHCELGAAMVEDWKLPKPFVFAIERHENPDAAEVPHGSRDYLLLHMMSLAGAIGGYCIQSESERRAMVPALILDAAKVGLDADVLGASIDHIVSEWREWGKMLEVKTQDVAKFEQPTIRVTDTDDHDRTKPHKAALPMSILIADDDETIRLVLEQTLVQQGHKVAVAMNGREALKLALEVRPQLVISDWTMPELDGVKFCRALRDTEEGRKMYFMLLTGMAHDDELVEGFEAGVDDYVTKPFNPKVLTARLRAAERVIHMQEEIQRDSQSMRKFGTELAVANRRLQQAALTDSLTGLPNRRHLMERIEQEWALAKRTQRPFALMMIDIDSFKLINDNHGHETGDQVLIKVAALLRSSARVEDIVGRIGGEEFVVICPGGNLPMGVRLAERLRLSLAQQPIAVGDLSLAVTVSIGVSQQDVTTATMDEVLRRADAALYRAKREGRNRVSGLAASDGPTQAAS